MAMYKAVEPFKGSPDGYTVIDYKIGEIMPLVPDLAKVALEQGWVELIEEPEKPKEPEGI